MTIADIRQGLRFYLLQDGAISTAVGGVRIYPIVLPQGIVLPSLVYSHISGLGDHHSLGASGLTRPRIQIDAWAQKADLATSLANLAKARIDGFSGEIEFSDSSPNNSVKVQGIFFESEREDYDDVAKLFRVSRDYFIWYEE